MDYRPMNAARDKVEKEIRELQHGPYRANVHFLEAVNKANRSIGRFSEGEAEEAEVQSALSELTQMVTTAPQGLQTSIKAYLVAAREALDNPKAFGGGTWDGTGDTDVKGDLTE